MSQSGMRSYKGDALAVANKRARRQLLQLQERVFQNTRQVEKFGGTYKPIGRTKATTAGTVVVRVEFDSGSAGSATQPCTFKYNIYADADGWRSTTPLATALTPVKRRTAFGKYIAAADGTRGLADLSAEDGLWRLLHAYREVEAVGTCSP